eukprot:1181399-Prorocentrum_minimum.AAC.4
MDPVELTVKTLLSHLFTEEFNSRANSSVSSPAGASRAKGERSGRKWGTGQGGEKRGRGVPEGSICVTLIAGQRRTRVTFVSPAGGPRARRRRRPARAPRACTPPRCRSLRSSPPTRPPRSRRSPPAGAAAATGRARSRAAGAATGTRGGARTPPAE